MRVLAIKEIADLFEHHARVAIAHRMQPVLNEFREEFFRVREIEIARHRNRARFSIGAPQIRMTHRTRTTTVRSVAKMPEHHFTKQAETTLQFEVAHRVERGLTHLARGRKGVIEESFDRIAFGGAFAFKKRIARRHVEFRARNSRAVLAAIVLFLHQEIEAAKSPQRIAVLLRVPIEWLSQANKRKAAFVSERIRHRARRVAKVLSACCLRKRQFAAESQQSTRDKWLRNSELRGKGWKRLLPHSLD